METNQNQIIHSTHCTVIKTGIQTDNEMQEPHSGVMTSHQGENPIESLQTFNPKNDL